MAVGVGGQDHLGATAQHLGADRLGVTHDQRGTVTRFAERVGAAADSDQHRLVLLDERLECFEIGCGTGLLGYHYDMPMGQVDVDVGNADAVDQQWALAPDELDGVAREGFQVGDQAPLGFLHQFVDISVGAFGAQGQAAVTGIQPAFVDPDSGAVFDLLEDVVAGLVDQGDAVGDQDLGAEVGVAAGDRGRGVDHGSHVRLDEGVGGDAIEVLRVHHGDVTGAEAAQQFVDVAVNAGGARDTRA